MHDHQETQLNTLKRIICYIRGIIDISIHTHPSTSVNLIAYYDVDLGDALSHDTPQVVIVSTLETTSFPSPPNSMPWFWDPMLMKNIKGWLMQLLRLVGYEISFTGFTDQVKATIVYCEMLVLFIFQPIPFSIKGSTTHILTFILFMIWTLLAIHFATRQVWVLYFPSSLQYANIFMRVFHIRYFWF